MPQNATFQEMLASYDGAASAYREGRPPYPAEGIRHLVHALEIRHGKHVVDLGSGTGKLTEALLYTKTTLTAIEPSPGMREVFRTFFPNITLMDGHAENIPLPDISVDVIVVGTAFHNFNNKPALQEISRILKPGGGFGLVWNVLDISETWVCELRELRKEFFTQNLIKSHSMDWKNIFHGQKIFTNLEHRKVSFTYLGTVEIVIQRLLSERLVAALSVQQQNDFVLAVCKLLKTSREKARTKKILIPYQTELYWCHKL